MNRRDFLLGSAAAALLPAAIPGLGSASAQIPDSDFRREAMRAWERRLRSILAKGRLPILDLQATYVPGTTNVPQMIQFMETSDVSQIAFAPAFSPNGAPSLELHRRYPELFIPTTSSGEIPRWWENPQSFLATARKDLESGMYFFMGEHEFRHYPSPEQVQAGQTFRDITIDIAGPAGEGLFALSEEFGVAFQIHHEIEDSLMPALESRLERHPRAKVIWCHLAMIRYPARAQRYDPDYVAGLIKRFPGLHFDLAVPQPFNIYRPSGARDSTLFTANGRIDPAWKALIEQFPERFLASSDYRPPVAHFYIEHMGRQRSLILDTLTDRAQHLVAYANAWRLLTGKNWTA